MRIAPLSRLIALLALFPVMAAHAAGEVEGLPGVPPKTSAPALEVQKSTEIKTSTEAAKPPDWALEFISKEQYGILSKGENRNHKAFESAALDPSWQWSHRYYLRKVYFLTPEEFAPLDKKARGKILFEWALERESAMQVLEGAENGLDPARLKLLNLYAQAGYYGPDLTAALLGEASPVAEALRKAASESAQAAATAATPEKSAMEAGKAFGDLENQVVAKLRFKQAFTPELGAPADYGSIDQVYRYARMMVMDPTAFRKERPDLFENATDEELKAQLAVREKLGHIFPAMDRLREQGRLQIEFGDDMGSGLLGLHTMTSSKDVRGRATWMLHVKLSSQLKDVDPALLTETMVHELQHAYDRAVNVERYGPPIAEVIYGYQEKEMRSFITGGIMGSAYLRAYHTAAARLPENSNAQMMDWEIEKLSRIHVLQEVSPEDYKPTLAKMSRDVLRERGYVHPWGGRNGVREIRDFYQEELRDLWAERVAAARGEAGLDEEIKKAAHDDAYRIALRAFKGKEVRGLAVIDRGIEQTRKMMAALDEDAERGLQLKALPLKNAREVPPPGVQK
ncbi:MAG: hypothetical protein HY611_00655 [Elusimicrobia bacterium]|nr:hypothetical protein [Elusimicrobiota bacterium]